MRLRPGQLDHFLPAPARREVVLRLHAREAPEKARLMFESPLPAGRHRFRIEVLGGRRDHTVVIATPVRPGRSRFTVSITGAGRFDLGFWADGGTAREYRVTLFAPVVSKTIDVDLTDGGGEGGDGGGEAATRR